MAIVSHSDSDKKPTSLELNQYDPAFSKTFDMPPPFNSTTFKRTTTYHSDSRGLNVDWVHGRDSEEKNPPDIWQEHYWGNRQLANRNNDEHVGVHSLEKRKGGAGTLAAIAAAAAMLLHHHHHRPGPAPPPKDLIMTENPGLYRVLYDWQAGTWSTQVYPPAPSPSITLSNGTFGATNIGDRDFFVFPSLDLHIPEFQRFNRSCKYEPFIKVHKLSDAGDETREQQMQRHAKMKYKADDGSVVMRARSPGLTQGRMELCAKRREMKEALEVVAGIVAGVRWGAYDRRRGCKV